MIYVLVDVMRDIVASVEAKLLAELQAYDPDIRGINYQHGHPIEIDQTLIDYDSLPDLRYEKFPLVALVEDISYDYGNDLPVANFRLVIIHNTQPDYKSAEREIKTFKPVLRPIYEALKEAMIESPYFNISDAISLRHRAWERKFWGREGVNGNEQNKFASAYIDAIDMQNVRVEVQQQSC